MQTEIINSLVGGIFIGMAVSVMLYFNGKIAGNSGIVAGIFTVVKDKAYWKLFYIAGLLLGALVYRGLNGGTLPITVVSPDPGLVVGGLLVGFGTRLGSGCTAGHGICGIARFSKRSITSTAIFMIFGILTVYVLAVAGGVL